MSVRFGLSSGSAPTLTATELAAAVRAAGGDVVDLRAGKGHRWEEQGIAGLDGLAVSFVGVSVVLGEPAAQLDTATRFPQRNIKVFAAPGSLGARTTAEQIDALTRDREPEQILVETHRGGAQPEELVALCQRYGCRLVVDNLGVHEITEDFNFALSRLSSWTSAIQVKGFDPGSPRTHRPLRSSDVDWLGEYSDSTVDIMVESRAGTPDRDLAVVREAWEAVACA